MENQIPSSKVSQAGLTALQGLFYDKLLTLEKGDGLKKQTLIDALMNDILKFIHLNHYSFFEVVVLQKDCEDIVNIEYGVMVKNFKHFVIDARNPYKWRIVIDQTWNKFTVYQRSQGDSTWMLQNNPNF